MTKFFLYLTFFSFYLSLVKLQSLIYFVDVVPKTPAHPFFGQGYIFEGYTLSTIDSLTLGDWTEGRSITLIAGQNTLNLRTKVVGWNANATSSGVDCSFHPVYITTSASGQGEVNSIGEITLGVSGSANGLYCNGTNLRWRPLLNQTSDLLPPGTSYWYQCRIHSKMGGQITVRQQTLCEKVNGLLGGGGWTNTLATNLFSTSGMLTSLNIYFNGNWGSNLITNTTARNSVANGHAQFFDDLFGCNSITNYTANIDTIHNRNGTNGIVLSSQIDNASWNIFVNFTINTLSGLGVTDPAILTQARGLLDSQKRFICKGAGCRTGICDLYVRVGENSTTWLTRVINYAFDNMQNNPLLQGYYLGLVGSKNYSSGSLNRATMVLKYVTWLGSRLGCTETGPWTGFNPNNTRIIQAHSGLPIGALEYQTYIQKMLQAFNDEGLTAADQAVVYNIFNDSALFPICNQPNCDPNGNIPIPLVFTVKDRSPSNPWFNIPNVWPQSYVVDGLEARLIVLNASVLYRFQNEAGCDHPLYLSSSPVGGRNSTGGITQEWTDGVTYPQGGALQVCLGLSLFFRPPAYLATGFDLYYQCTDHVRMGYIVRICNNNVCSRQPPVTTTGIATTAAPRVTTVRITADLVSSGFQLQVAFATVLLFIISLLL